ncbi:MAG TPA: hypothetical protein VEA41_01835 [Salinarimonas sp.]|nr:hypothetical protein [Salinarimonas sp.]
MAKPSNVDKLIADLEARYGSDDEETPRNAQARVERTNQLKAKQAQYADRVKRLEAAPGPGLADFGEGAWHGANAAAAEYLNGITGGGYREAVDAVMPRMGELNRQRREELMSTPLGAMSANVMNASAGLTMAPKSATQMARQGLTLAEQDAARRGVLSLPDAASQVGDRAVHLASKLPGRLGVRAQIPQGAIAGATSSGFMGANQSILRGDAPAEVLQSTLDAGKEGALWGTALATAGKTAQSTEDWIRSEKSPRGQNLRVLERYGSSPSAKPFSPVRNAPSDQLGLPASSRGRGLAGEMAAEKLQSEVSAQARMAGQRLEGELAAARASQGDRMLSVQKHVDDIDALLADPKVDLQTGLRTKLEISRKILTGELEPSMDVFTSRAQPVRGSVGVVEEMLETPLDIYTTRMREVTAGEHPAGVFVHRGGEVAPRGRYYDQGNLPNNVTGRAVTVDVDEPVTVRSTEREGFPTQQMSVESAEPVRVPLGDIRGRVGDKPNYVMPADKLNQVRDLLDEVAGVDARAAGISKEKYPLFQLSNQMRHETIKRGAPAYALANRRFADRSKKLERTTERMRTEDNESLGMQIAGIGEEGAKQAGVRERRLSKLRSQFPVSEHMPPSKVDELFDNSRRLLAEEMLEMKKLPRIGGGDDAILRSEPFLSRGLYPMAGFARHTGELARILGPAVEARRQRNRERAEKMKRGGK